MALYMKNSVLDVMRARYRTLIRTISSLEKANEGLPGCSIYIRIHKGYSYFYTYSSSGEKYLGKKDFVLIRQLVQKEQIKQALEAAELEAKVLKKDILEYPKTTFEKAYLALDDRYIKYASPLIFSDEDYAKEWLAIPFVPKPFSKDAPEYYTMKGERVRSKSEVIIADRLYIKGIPYKYECPVLIGGVVFHPDFTILRLSDRKILYHEHCGKMGDSGYVEDMIDRANKYAKAQIFQGDRLFYTFESADHPLDISWFNDFIEKNFR